ncbi:pyridoxamine 5'-phosphate oxidase family protein [Thermoanaerobacterium saccharolyticum]|uniref:pyridoxamine 5'-phosphate oxidase family protein n=1 Tax=Thermoanaerobacterium saccharolyticum TaxID=28896 RepID=UPI0005EE95D3
MEEVLQFLKDNPTFYIATVNGDTPKVRPFGFVMEYNGKICFCTNNQKDVYKQLKANPKFEISITSKTGEWLRLKGKAVFITSRESKKAALDTMPSLRNLYSEDDSIFEIFYADEAEATFYGMSGPVKTVKI